MPIFHGPLLLESRMFFTCPSGVNPKQLAGGSAPLAPAVGGSADIVRSSNTAPWAQKRPFFFGILTFPLHLMGVSSVLARW